MGPSSSARPSLWRSPRSSSPPSSTTPPPRVSSPSSRGRKAWTGSGCASASSRCRRARCRRSSRAGRAPASTPGAAAAHCGPCAKPSASNMRVVTLAGGTGAAKLLRGLAACVPQRDLTVIVNTGDDTEIWGLHVSPDLDSVTYALAGTLDVERGWGLADETFQCLRGMAAYGADTWFNLGDRDLATHLTRTRALRDGQPLSGVTARLAASLGVAARILPMSDDPVRTMIQTLGGRLTFQEYFVREKALVDVVGVDYEGATAARPAPGVLDAIRTADLVVVCPSNPVTSVGPILAVPGIVDALGATPAPVVGVSPIVGGAAVALMRARGLPISPLGVAAAYAPWLRHLLIDRSDLACVAELGELGVEADMADIVMKSRAHETELARRVLEPRGARRRPSRGGSASHSTAGGWGPRVRGEQDGDRPAGRGATLE